MADPQGWLVSLGLEGFMGLHGGLVDLQGWGCCLVRGRGSLAGGTKISQSGLCMGSWGGGNGIS